MKLGTDQDKTKVMVIGKVGGMTEKLRWLWGMKGD